MWPRKSARTPARTLRALARLLQYPDHTLRAQLPALQQVLGEDDALSTARRSELQALLAGLQRAEPLALEAAYVDLFDRGRATALNLFEHVHADSRERGPAMVDLVRTYEQGGLILGPGELPDHLGVVLEFASTLPATQAREFLGEVAHIVRALFSALLRRGSAYAAIMAAVLDLAGQSADPVPVTEDEPLDRSWAEPQAFDGCNPAGAAGGPGVHVIHWSAPRHRTVQGASA